MALGLGDIIRDVPKTILDGYTRNARHPGRVYTGYELSFFYFHGYGIALGLGGTRLD
uniref:Uncharacterized protein n=1 Tax=Helianthus annuus TaxID=4232 RepID=A0A251T602_HELAN